MQTMYRVHGEMARRVDRPTAALIKDLKRGGCWRARSSFGEVSLAGRPITDAVIRTRPPGPTIILTDLRLGWLAVE